MSKMGRQKNLVENAANKPKIKVFNVVFLHSEGPKNFLGSHDFSAFVFVLGRQLKNPCLTRLTKMHTRLIFFIAF